MLRTMFKSKIHRATVTDADLHYEGSITIDKDLMDAAGMYEYEKVDIYNITNGARFSTYTINGERGSGEICLNGAAARHVQVGDMIIIVCYVQCEENEIDKLKQVVVQVDENNKILNKEAVLV
jgi:aspartate 1-decarboxylase